MARPRPPETETLEELSWAAGSRPAQLAMGSSQLAAGCAQLQLTGSATRRCRGSRQACWRSAGPSSSRSRSAGRAAVASLGRAGPYLVLSEKPH
eukprot:scaffold631_cov378-Prasinococcus_capsulatus_cf.AAC.16